jgi:hypothetical protein
MMAMPIMAVVSTGEPTTRKTKSGGQVRERTIIYEGSPSPRELLESLAIQAEAAIKGLEGPKQNEEETQELTEEQKRMAVDSKGKSKETNTTMSEENRRLLDFCQRILSTIAAIDRSLRDTKGDKFVDRLQASLPRAHASSSNDVRPEAGETEESAKKAYVEWATRVRFEYCDLTVPASNAGAGGDDDTPHFKFYYNNEARMLAHSDIPKRSLAIAKEVGLSSCRSINNL